MAKNTCPVQICPSQLHERVPVNLATHSSQSGPQFRKFPKKWPDSIGIDGRISPEYATTTSSRFWQAKSENFKIGLRKKIPEFENSNADFAYKIM